MVLVPLMLLVASVTAQTPLFSLGDFLTARHFTSSQVPSCLTPACDDDTNVNFFLN